MDIGEYRDRLASVMGSTHSANTIRCYASHVKRVNTLVPGHVDDPMWPCPFVLAEALKEIPPTSRPSVTGALVKWLELRSGTDPQVLSGAREQLRLAFLARDKARPDPNRPTERQVSNLCTMAELQKCLSKRGAALRKAGVLTGEGTLDRGSYEELRLWVIGSMYVCDASHPPRRLEYRSVRVISGGDYALLPDDVRDDENFLIVYSRNSKDLVLNSYKTAPTYGQYRVRIGSALNSVLNTWLKYHRGDFLFGDAELSSSHFGGLINRCFAGTGKVVSVNVLRHAYLSKYPSDAVERHRDAKAMGHSIATQLTYPLRSAEEQEAHDAESGGAAPAPPVVQ